MLRLAELAVLAWCLLLTGCALHLGLGCCDDGPGSAWSLDEVHPGQEYAVDRRMLSGITTVKGLPPRFTLRSLINTTLCVHRASLRSAAVVSARARSGLPPTDPAEIRQFGAARLVLMPCAESAADTFLAETLLGRRYTNSGTSYREGFLKPPNNNSVCVYGLNASHTAGHPSFGVSSTYPGGSLASQTEMDWFDDYSFDYASYTRYGYDPTQVFATGTFISPNPLPLTALDASGWGPFHTSWGPCMRNPTLDTATPDETVASEVELRYHSWIFINNEGTASASHLSSDARSGAHSVLTLGPDRPQPDMSPDAGSVDAGQISAELGGTDSAYGNGYSALVSKELCLTTSTVREGAQVRLAPCNPVKPSLEQLFKVVRRAAKAAAAAA